MIYGHNSAYVFIHLPKTGGTYCGRILRQFFKGAYNKRGHDTPRPQRLRKRKLSDPIDYSRTLYIGCLRDPLEYYVSLFYTAMDGKATIPIPQVWRWNDDHVPYHEEGFRNPKKCGWLKNSLGPNPDNEGRHQPTTLEAERKSFRNFIHFIYNEIHDSDSISTYGRNSQSWHGMRIDYMDKRPITRDVGPYTRMYTLMYLSNDYDMLVNEETYMSCFIRNAHIEKDVLKIMSDIGYSCKLEEVKSFGENLVTSPAGRNINLRRKWDYVDYYDEDLIELVRHKERYIYHVLKASDDLNI